MWQPCDTKKCDNFVTIQSFWQPCDRKFWQFCKTINICDKTVTSNCDNFETNESCDKIVTEKRVTILKQVYVTVSLTSNDVQSLSQFVKGHWKNFCLGTNLVKLHDL